jgi:acyl carrier protein
MSSEPLEQTVIQIIAKSKNIDTEGITSATPMEDLGLDSLDGMSLIFDLENEFDIEIPDGAAESARTVGDLVAGVAQLVEARGKGAPASEA